MLGIFEDGLGGTERGVPRLSKFSLVRVAREIFAVTQFLRWRNDLVGI
jgi:hypothetical protein